MRRMAIISAGFVPVPAVNGGAGEVLTTYLIEGNEEHGDYYMDIYTINSPKLDGIKYQNAEIIQIRISFINKMFCKARNMFLKLFKRKYRFIPYNRKLLQVFRDNYDVILIENNMQVYEDIYKHAKNAKDNIVFHLHNDIDGTTKPEYLVEVIGKTAKLILSVSQYINNRVLNVYNGNNTEVFYNCVDTRLFDETKYDSRESRKEYDVSEDAFVYLFAGSVYPGKGVLELLKAFKRIRIKCKNTKLMIVGSRWYNVIDKDEYFYELQREAEECKDDIIFTGYVEPTDMPKIYSIADVVVIPSICEEAFPMVALESMAMKKAIIGTNSGGMVESLLADKVAIIVDKKNEIVDGLEKAMIKIYSDENLRNTLKDNAYREIYDNTKYSINNYYKTFKRFLEKYEV